MNETCEEHWENNEMNNIQAKSFINEAILENKEVQLLCISDAYKGLDIAFKVWQKEIKKLMEEINILRDQHITKQFVDHAIAESYRVNAKRREQVAANNNKILQLQAEVVAWEGKEKTRVLDSLREACLEQKRKYESSDK